MDFNTLVKADRQINKNSYRDTSKKKEAEMIQNGKLPKITAREFLTKSRNNPFPSDTLHERYSKEKTLNPQTQYTAERIEDGYFTFKSKVGR